MMLFKNIPTKTNQTKHPHKLPRKMAVTLYFGLWGRGLKIDRLGSWKGWAFRKNGVEGPWIVGEGAAEASPPPSSQGWEVRVLEAWDRHASAKVSSRKCSGLMRLCYWSDRSDQSESFP